MGIQFFDFLFDSKHNKFKKCFIFIGFFFQFLIISYKF
jgi:hypothetical protein